MINMDYCKFENTAAALRECMEELTARIENGANQDDIDFTILHEDGSVGEMSEYEQSGLMSILHMAAEIAEYFDISEYA